VSFAPLNRAARRKVMRFLRRKRGLAAVTAALLLVPAALASDAVPGWGTTDQPLTPLANGLGRGFFGIDLEDLGASGELPEVSQLSEELMRLADDPNALANAGDPLSVPSGVLGIPGPSLQAYKKAEQILAAQLPGCHLTWPLLASIGRIESNHGNSGQVNTKGDTLDKILGPVLDGNGFAAIADTDRGSFDGNTQWDRAVGPMQFIPGTWKTYAADGNGDGVSNPHNIYDSATAAGKYLCAGGVDLSNAQMRYQAVFRYNHSDSYVSTVLIWADAYARGVTEIPPGLGGGSGNGTTYPNPDAQASGQPAQEPIQTTPTTNPTSTTTSTSRPPVDTTITPKPPTTTKTTTTTSVKPCPTTTTPTTSSSTTAANTPSSELSGSGSPSQSAAAPSEPSPQGAVAPADPCKPNDEDDN
jgi:hypothetical protein